MRSALPPIPALEMFLAVARTGGVGAAAKALNVTDSAVSHQLRKLENHLGTPLVERRGRGIQLTPLGRRYSDQLAPLMSEVSDLTARLFGAPETGTVVLTAGPVVASLGLIPFITALETDHPDVVLQFVTTTRFLDLDAMGIDLALRYERCPADPADPLSFPEYAFPVCTPDLVAEDAASTLAKRRLFNSAHSDDWSCWAAGTNRTLPAPAQQMLFDSAEMVMGAALQGMGIAMGRTPIVNAHIASGALVAPFGAQAVGEGSYRIVLSSRGRRDKVEAVIGWLSHVLGKPTF